MRINNRVNKFFAAATATVVAMAIAVLLLATAAYAQAQGGLAGSCGNGVCENFGCLSLDCAAPETWENCAQDCPPSCNDGFRNQDETGVDCGGSCFKKHVLEVCDGKDNDKDCLVDEDCKTNTGKVVSGGAVLPPRNVPAKSEKSIVVTSVPYQITIGPSGEITVTGNSSPVNLSEIWRLVNSSGTRSVQDASTTKEQVGSTETVTSDAPFSSSATAEPSEPLPTPTVMNVVAVSEQDESLIKPAPPEEPKELIVEVQEEVYESPPPSNGLSRLLRFLNRDSWGKQPVEDAPKPEDAKETDAKETSDAYQKNKVVKEESQSLFTKMASWFR
ncbi:hypothetical protein HYX10_02070 [Candidatus Woesearchaeota archaeon]|nr:hypothetical protein [Candidatus Woesearchaeota archaeon]